jgi:hypothetical protein
VISAPTTAIDTKPNGLTLANNGKKENHVHASVVPAVSVEELRRPAFLEHQRSNKKAIAVAAVVPSAINGHGHGHGHGNGNGNGNGKEKKHAVTVENNEKSWMKIVKLSKEEQDEMENQSTKSSSIGTTTKLTQKEAIIIELKKFFSSNAPPTTTTKGKLTDDVKEVTKIEMRNDLSKKQLLYILLVSLLEETDQSMLTILKSRDHLFKTVSFFIFNH